jgi:hypothetical protein
VIFAVEPLEAVWSEIYEPPHGLAYQHWNETQGHRHWQGYAPSFERYRQYEKGGYFIQFSARDDGRLVGYGGAFLLLSMHSGQMICQEDTWYLLGGYRSGWNAVRFYKFMQAECEKRGAVEANLTLPADRNLDPIVRRLGYTNTARLYSKPLSARQALKTGETPA